MSRYEASSLSRANLCADSMLKNMSYSGGMHLKGRAEDTVGLYIVSSQPNCRGCTGSEKWCAAGMKCVMYMCYMLCTILQNLNADAERVTHLSDSS